MILNDRPARRLAAGLGLPVVGTTGILLRAKRAGLVTAVRPLLDQLLQVDFRLSQAIRAKVLEDAGRPRT